MITVYSGYFDTVFSYGELIDFPVAWSGSKNILYWLPVMQKAAQKEAWLQRQILES